MNFMTLFPTQRRQPSQCRDGMAMTPIKETLMVRVGKIQHLGFVASMQSYKNLTGSLTGHPVAAATCICLALSRFGSWRWFYGDLWI